MARMITGDGIETDPGNQETPARLQQKFEAIMGE
jgi:hypothetical protein